MGDGHNLRRSDGDANWIAVNPTEPACLGHTSYIGHSKVLGVLGGYSRLLRDGEDVLNATLSITYGSDHAEVIAF